MDRGLFSRHSAGAILGTLVFLVTFAGPVSAQGTSAQNQTLSGDARAQGMGRAFTALAEAPSATWWNPGSLSMQGDRVILAPFSYSKLIPDLSDDVWWFHGDAVWDAGPVGVGLHYRRLFYGERDFVDNMGRSVGTYSPNDYSVHLGVGVDLIQLIDPDSDVFSLGIGLAGKRVGANMAPAGIFTRVASEGYADDLDFGILPQFRVPLDNGSLEVSLGWTRKNLLESELGETAAGLGSLTAHNRMGTAVSVDLQRPNLSGSFLRLTGTWEYAEDPNPLFNPNNRDSFHYGAEALLGETMAIRIGHIDGQTDGAVDGITFGAGVAVNLPLESKEQRYGFQIDVGSVPQAPDLDRVIHYSGFFWIRP